MPGILPDYVGSPDCEARLARIAPGDFLAGSELGTILSEKATAEAANTIAAERKRREDVLAAAVEHVIETEYLREIACTWPDETTMQRYTAEYRTFTAWCRARGLGWLPAASTTVAGYLLDRVMTDAITTDAATEMARAIEFSHDATSNYLDRVPVAAALKFIAHVEDEMIGLAVETSDGLVKPKTNGNGAVHADDVHVSAEEAR
jgi:hypothetical protein